ncbi:hypothetical protein GCM10028790_15480 [Micromonospora taraxaci]
MLCAWIPVLEGGVQCIFPGTLERVPATRLRPPPGRRTRPNGSSPDSSSNTPLRTVVSLTVVSLT